MLAAHCEHRPVELSPAWCLVLTTHSCGSVTVLVAHSSGSLPWAVVRRTVWNTRINLLNPRKIGNFYIYTPQTSERKAGKIYMYTNLDKLSGCMSNYDHQQNKSSVKRHMIYNTWKVRPILRKVCTLYIQSCCTARTIPVHSQTDTMECSSVPDNHLLFWRLKVCEYYG